MDVTQRHELVGQLFLNARALAVPDRRAYLDDAINDADVRDEVVALLDAESDSGGFMESRAVPLELNLSCVLEAVDPCPPRRIGHYELLERIGEGTFAVVYRARQEHPIRRTVAVKLIKAGLDTAHVVSRFNAERQAMAMLDHPGIARILAADIASSGQPYFVMELVEGAWITAHCRQAGLDVAQRLELFALVCDAVQHAHWRGVIHRDLKPLNILIATVDGHAAPKIIDFGVAKILGDQALRFSHATADGHLIGTLEYMSPEQCRGDARFVDARTDVYSLGAVLYELLAGRPPLALDGRSLPDAVRLVQEGRPAVLRTINPALHTDLQTIVDHALAKDPRQRYGSAMELAADVRRHLRDEPLSVSPPGAIWQIRRIARRHRPLVAASLMAVFSILVALVFTATAWQRSERDLQTARTAANVMIKAVERMASTVGAVRQRQEALTGAIRNVDASLKDQPGEPNLLAIRAFALSKLGDIEREQGRTQEAEDLQREALRIHKRITSEYPGRHEFRAALSINIVKIGDLLKESGREAQARVWYSRALEIDEALAKGYPENANYVDNLTWSYERMGALSWSLGEMTEAERFHRLRFDLIADIAARQSASALARYGFSAALGHTAMLADARGDHLSALEHRHTALQIAEHITTAEPDNKTYRLHFACLCRGEAGTLMQSGDVEGATLRLQEALDILDGMHRLEPENLDLVCPLAECMAAMALIAQRQNDPDSAQRWMQRALGHVQAERGTDSQVRAAACVKAGLLESHAQILMEQGEVEPAVRARARRMDVLSQLAERPEASHADLCAYAESLMWTAIPGRRDLDTARRCAESAAGMTSRRNAWVLMTLAHCHHEQGDLQAAIDIAGEALVLVPREYMPLRTSISDTIGQWRAEADTTSPGDGT